MMQEVLDLGPYEEILDLSPYLSPEEAGTLAPLKKTFKLTGKFALAVGALVAASSVAGVSIAMNTADILAREEMMHHSNWETDGELRLTVQNDSRKFIWFGDVTGTEETHYFITTDPSARANSGEQKILVDSPDLVLAEASDIVESADRVSQLSGEFQRSIAGQRGMNGRMGDPVNGMRITLEGMENKNPDAISRYLDHSAFALLETQQKTTGIAYTNDWYRYQFHVAQTDMRNRYLEFQMDVGIKMEDIKAGWNVMVNGREEAAVISPSP